MKRILRTIKKKFYTLLTKIFLLFFNWIGKIALWCNRVHIYYLKKLAKLEIKSE